MRSDEAKKSYDLHNDWDFCLSPHHCFWLDDYTVVLFHFSFIYAFDSQSLNILVCESLNGTRSCFWLLFQYGWCISNWNGTASMGWGLFSCPSSHFSLPVGGAWLSGTCVGIYYSFVGEMLTHTQAHTRIHI